MPNASGMPAAGNFNGPPKGKYGSGQNSMSSPLCMATMLDGKPCMKPKAYKNVPYCDECFKKGDPSIAVVPHPRFGKMCVAKRELPKKYYFALFGDLTFGKDMPDDDKEWGFETQEGNFVNPTKFGGSQAQFCQCPGPNEKVTVAFATPHLYTDFKDKKNSPYGSFLFHTTCAVPNKHQLCMMYAENAKAANEFFEERGLTRCDVWTKEYPTITKQGVKVPDGLMMYPHKGHIQYANSSFKAKGDENEKVTSKKSMGGGKSKMSSGNAMQNKVAGKVASKAKKNSKKVKKD